MAGEKITVGIINSSKEIIEILQLAFEMEGFETVTAHLQDFKQNPLKFPKFIKKYQPKVLVIDVPPPYEENWGFAKKLQAIEVSGKIGFVYTTTNKRALDGLVGENEAVEVIGKPFDLLEVVQAATRTYQITHITRNLKSNLPTTLEG